MSFRVQNKLSKHFREANTEQLGNSGISFPILTISSTSEDFAQISFSLTGPVNSFHLNGHTLGFQKLELLMVCLCEEKGQFPSWLICCISVSA